jgi:hypothetical protein
VTEVSVRGLERCRALGGVMILAPSFDFVLCTT